MPVTGKTAEVELGGKMRRLKMDLNAMVTFEEVTGKSLFEIKEARLGVKDLRALLYSCLRGEEPELTLEQVGSWIDMGNMAEVAGKITEAFSAAVGEGETDPLAPGGSGSGVSGGTTSG